VRTVLDRMWTAEKEVESNILPFDQWVKDNVNRRRLDMTSVEEMDMRLQCTSHCSEQLGPSE
jgi:hypothetical protein